MTIRPASTSLPHNLHGDIIFFAAKPDRRFRARPYCGDDFSVDGMPVQLFAQAAGQLAAVNLVIVKRIVGGRQRMHFAAPEFVQLGSDRVIIAFLRSRGIKPGRGLSPMMQ